MFRKITIIGIGLIGSSIGMAIKRNKMARLVVGSSRRHGPLVAALKNGAIDKISHDAKKAVEGADLVILATPVKTIVNLFSIIGRHLKRGCIVIDVGSTKSEIVQLAERDLPAHVHFIGTHPLAGSEKKGAYYGHPDLFKDSVCIMTPTQKTNKAIEQKVRSFWVRLGATVKSLTPIEHDQILSHVSHLPHLLAYGLVSSVPDRCLEYASTGFKGTTRIAASDPQMWNDICMANKKNILEALDALVKNLSVLRKTISSSDEQNLIAYFKESKRKRDAIS